MTFLSDAAFDPCSVRALFSVRACALLWPVTLFGPVEVRAHSSAPTTRCGARVSTTRQNASDNLVSLVPKTRRISRSSGLISDDDARQVVEPRDGGRPAKALAAVNADESRRNATATFSRPRPARSGPARLRPARSGPGRSGAPAPSSRSAAGERHERAVGRCPEPAGPAERPAGPAEQPVERPVGRPLTSPLPGSRKVPGEVAVGECAPEPARRPEAEPVVRPSRARLRTPGPQLAASSARTRRPARRAPARRRCRGSAP